MGGGTWKEEEEDFYNHSFMAFFPPVYKKKQGACFYTEMKLCQKAGGEEDGVLQQTGSR